MMYESTYLPPGEMWVYHTDTDQWINVICNGHPPPGLAGASAVIASGGLYILFGHSGRLIYWFGGYGSSVNGYLCEHGSFTLDSTGVHSEWWSNQLLEFDIEEQLWRDLKCTGDVPLPRAAHAVDKFENSNLVYLFGGRHKTTRLNDLYHLDLNTWRWTRLHIDGPEPEGRSWHTFSAVSQKHFLLVGGYTSNFKPLNDAWVLDTELLQWTEVYCPLDKPRLWHTAAVTCDKEVLVFGGCCNDIMDNQIDTEYTNELAIFRLAPKSLTRLCFDAAFTYRSQLKESWDSLPKDLSKVLHMRLEGLSCDLLNRTQYQAKTQGRSCVIS